MKVSVRRGTRHVHLLDGWIEPLPAKNPMGVFLMSTEGVQALVAKDSLRSCVDFVEMCEEKLGIAGCYILIPKRTVGAQQMIKFLGQCLDVSFAEAKGVELLRGYDTLDWFVCKCEL